MNVKLFVVQGRPAGKRLSFPLGEFYFGRGGECQVRPLSEWVSRQHCLLRVTAEGASLRARPAESSSASRRLTSAGSSPRRGAR